MNYIENMKPLIWKKGSKRFIFYVPIWLFLSAIAVYIATCIYGMKIGISVSETIDAILATGDYPNGLPSELNERMYHFGTYYLADLTSLMFLYILVVYMFAKGIWVTKGMFRNTVSAKMWYIAICTIFIYCVLESIITFFSHLTGQNQELIEESFRHAPLMMFVTTVFTAPILEEIIFRRYLFGIFLQMEKKVWKWFGFLFNSFLFGGLHLASISEINLLPFYVIPGFLFSYAYAKTGRLVVPIVMHIITNGFATLTFFITQ
ncbi:CPBP family intramembrane glutamic endopeptidase [Gottfriedia luciferensis]|uniref:CPBP family intramembrane glutamic endopeptidase n=1 Tax=Gottfriedia luciferensis TaxID=178774 RepID=UPI000B441687|nr:CPBP family intramembrane glutamic endopeptidase [Gottfriedia luciferensis]